MSVELGGACLDVIGIIYEMCIQESRYVLALATKGWNAYCMRRIKTDLNSACENGDILGFIKYYNCKIHDCGDIIDKIPIDGEILPKIIWRHLKQYDNEPLRKMCRFNNVGIMKYAIADLFSDGFNYQYAVCIAFNHAINNGYMNITNLLAESAGKQLNAMILHLTRNQFIDKALKFISYIKDKQTLELCFTYACQMVNIDYNVVVSRNMIRTLIKAGVMKCDCGKSVYDHLPD